MKLIVDRATHQPVQTTSSDSIACAGKYILELPPGTSVVLSRSSYVLNAGVEDGGSVTTLAFNQWLTGYPEFSTVLYNLFLNAAGHNLLNFTTSEAIGLGTYRARAQRGATGAGLTLGAGTVALMPPNPTVSGGYVSTENVDITAAPYAAAATDRFLPWWSVSRRVTTQDISSQYGVHAGTVEPAAQTWERLSPANVQVHLSNDGGATWTEVSWMTPVTLPAVDKDVKLAFFNMSSDKVWLDGYGLLF